MSASLSAKSKIAAFSATRSDFAVFDKAANPCWTSHRSATCAQRFCRRARQSDKGWLPRCRVNQATGNWPF
jgi:hypothetical protein